MLMSWGMGGWCVGVQEVWEVGMLMSWGMGGWCVDVQGVWEVGVLVSRRYGRLVC